jgi:hypothetical protein
MRCVTFDTNSRSLATSQLKGFNFAAMGKVGENYIGINSEGFYILTGDTDDGTQIDAWIKTGLTDLGIPAEKRLRKIYLGIKTDGDIEIDVIADGNVSRTYTVLSTSGIQKRIRLAVGRDGKGTYWSFVIRNKKGVQFTIDFIQILPVVLHYGHL